MNEVYLQRLQEDLRLKNYAKNTREDYYRFVVRFLDFTGKDAMSVTYADIRKFVFHMMDNESKKASTINAYTAAIRFFFEYTLGYVWDPKKLPKMKRDRYLPVVLTREQVGMLIDSMDNYKHKAITATMYSSHQQVKKDDPCAGFEEQAGPLYDTQRPQPGDPYGILVPVRPPKGMALSEHSPGRAAHDQRCRTVCQSACPGIRPS